jgi:mRNA interferase MazF
VLVLTRELVRPHLNTVTVAPLTTTNPRSVDRSALRPAYGLKHRRVVACDHINTIPAASLGRQIGQLLDDQERDLARAIYAAFDLEQV